MLDAGKFKVQFAIDVSQWLRRLSVVGSACAVLGTAYYIGWRRGLSGPENYVSHDVTQNDEIEAILSKLDLNDDQLANIMSLLEEEINKGLDPATAENSDLKMIPSFVRHLPNGREQGKVIALDLGGTNFRVLEVDLREDRQIETNSKMFVVPKRVMTGTGEELFDYLAASISNFIKTQQIVRRGGVLPCGFTFSFPCQQLALNSARLMEWTKGFQCSDCVGNDVVQMLTDAMRRRKDVNLDIIAIISDTVGTMLNCAYKYRDCQIGVIFGTGCNACYLEDLDRVKTWTGDRDYPRQIIINTEWGAFGDNGCLDIIRTKYDHEVDKASLNPGKQKFEKMISGMYMGELARQIVHDLIEKRLIFQGLLEGKRNSNKEENEEKSLITPGTFYTKFVSDIETDEGVAFSRAKQLMEEFGIDMPTYDDCAILKQVCERISKRSALLAAAAIAVLINRIGRHTITVAVDGSLYRCHPKFRRNLDQALSRLVARKIEYKTVLSDDGSGRGAAICAAVYQRVKQEAETKADRETDKQTRADSFSRSSSTPVLQRKN